MPGSKSSHYFDSRGEYKLVPLRFMPRLLDSGICSDR